jgi:Undecaprenyl-phosphate glucose phosphotransferase
MSTYPKQSEDDRHSLHDKIERADSSNISDTASAPDSEHSAKLNSLAAMTAEHLRSQSYSPKMFLGLYRLFEFVSILLIGLIIVFMNTNSSDYTLLIASLVTCPAVLTVLFLQLADCYTVSVIRSGSRSLVHVLCAWILSFMPGPFALPATLDEQSMTLATILAWFAIGALFLITERLIVAHAVRRWARNGIMERRAVIVGGGESVRDLIRNMERLPDNDIRICGIFDDRDDSRSAALTAGYPKLGTIPELVEFARAARIDLLIISLPLSAEDRILALLKTLWVLPVDIRIAAHSRNLKFRTRHFSSAASATSDMIEVYKKPIADWDSVAKRVFDLFFASLSLLLLWPIMVATALAIKLDSKGPVFFVQKRHGFNNEVIPVFKFRSMFAEKSDPLALSAVTKGDPRVTRVGRFIRKTSIDELPQLFNVLIGNLSLVGPRPHAVRAHAANRLFADIAEGYFARHRVKPGVTGWAQINGWRGEIDSDEKIRARTACDLYYIENWSLFFDFKILVMTPFSLLNTENAY